MEANALSLAARQLRTYLAAKLPIDESQILIGHPSAAIKEAESETGKQHLNLFFYRVEHGAYPADGASEDPFYVRLYCLITAIGSKETGNQQTVSAGENDLRLIGGVMAWLHRQPALRLVDEAQQEVARLQVVLHALSLDDLNHIWSTQGETPYRLSVAYELALAPVPLGRARERAPRVATIGAEVVDWAAGQPATAIPFTGTPLAPTVGRVVVETSQPDWAPHISFVHAGRLAYVLSFAATATPATVEVVAAGKPDTEITLVWEQWDRGRGWTTSLGAPLQVKLQTPVLDPDDLTSTTTIELPISAPGQALLHARRNWRRPDGAEVTLRSNPLLVTVYRETPA
jgi:hypothetical protein